MALIKCTECGKDFSEFADCCPECGCPTDIIKKTIVEKQKAQNEKRQLEEAKKQREQELQKQQEDAWKNNSERVLENFTETDLSRYWKLNEMIYSTAIDGGKIKAIVTAEGTINRQVSYWDYVKDDYDNSNLDSWKYIARIARKKDKIYGITHSGRVVGTDCGWISNLPPVKDMSDAMFYMLYLGKDGKVYQRELDLSNLSVVTKNYKLDPKRYEKLFAQLSSWKNIKKISVEENLRVIDVLGIGKDGRCYAAGFAPLPIYNEIQKWEGIIDGIIGRKSVPGQTIQPMAMGLKKDGTVICANVDDSELFESWRGIVAIDKIISDFLAVRIDGALIDKHDNVIEKNCIGFANSPDTLKALVVKADGSVVSVEKEGNTYKTSKWADELRLFNNVKQFVEARRDSERQCEAANNSEEQNAKIKELEDLEAACEEELSNASFFQKKVIQKKYDLLISKAKTSVEELNNVPFDYKTRRLSDVEEWREAQELRKKYNSIEEAKLAMIEFENAVGVASYTSSKDASVIGRAAAGAVIAGPAGAVVGALSAVDKNNRNRK